MVGESIAMRALRKQIAIVAPSDGRVLISGESGTGKRIGRPGDPFAVETQES
jgi:two-component system nitrogen regulation response regulator NtrX